MFIQSLVSVIVPVYNAEKYLAECVDSILAQTYRELEVILVDDGSTDGSGAVCDAYAARDTRVRAIHSPNEGVVEARIKGFRASRGGMIVFVDADDRITPEMFAHMRADMVRTGADVVGCQYCKYTAEDGHRERTAYRPQPGWYDRRAIDEMLRKNFLFDTTLNMAGMNPFFHCKFFVREFAMEALTVGRGISYAEDQIGMFVLLQRIQGMYITGGYYYDYRMHPEQTTKAFNERMWQRIRDYLERLRTLDTEGILRAQFGARCFLMLQDLVNMAIRGGKDDAYIRRHAAAYIRQFPETMQVSTDGWGFKMKCKYFLLKHQAYRAYRYCLDARGATKIGGVALKCSSSGEETAYSFAFRRAGAAVC